MENEHRARQYDTTLKRMIVDIMAIHLVEEAIDSVFSQPDNWGGTMAVFHFTGYNQQLEPKLDQDDSVVTQVIQD